MSPCHVNSSSWLCTQEYINVWINHLNNIWDKNWDMPSCSIKNIPWPSDQCINFARTRHAVVNTCSASQGIVIYRSYSITFPQLIQKNVPKCTHLYAMYGPHDHGPSSIDVNCRLRICTFRMLDAQNICVPFPKLWTCCVGVSLIRNCWDVARTAGVLMASGTQNQRATHIVCMQSAWYISGPSMSSFQPAQ